MASASACPPLMVARCSSAAASRAAIAWPFALTPTSSTSAGRRERRGWRTSPLEAQVKRRFRLTRSTDFKRVRRFGKSYAHPLIVLYKLKSDQPGVRVGVTAGLLVGNAVRRNRAKRLLREAMNALLPQTILGRCPEPVEGFDLMLIARPPLADSKLQQTIEALSSLLERADLLPTSHDERISA
jgi:ribonuclease P protein component